MTWGQTRTGCITASSMFFILIKWANVELWINVKRLALPVGSCNHFTTWQMLVWGCNFSVFLWAWMTAKNPFICRYHFWTVDSLGCSKTAICTAKWKNLTYEAWLVWIIWVNYEIATLDLPTLKLPQNVMTNSVHVYTMNLAILSIWYFFLIQNTI